MLSAISSRLLRNRSVSSRLEVAYLKNLRDSQKYVEEIFRAVVERCHSHTDNLPAVTQNGGIGAG